MSSKTTGATGVAGRYATALFDLAEQENALDQVSEDLSALQKMVRDSAELTRLIRSPVIARDDQAKAMTALLDKAEMSALTKKFVGVIIANRRLFALVDIITAFQALLAERRGEVTASVVAAKELTQKQLSALGASLKKAVGSDVALDVQVDPSLLGGLVVQVGSRMVDSSLRTKLQHLQLAMKGVG